VTPPVSAPQATQTMQINPQEQGFGDLTGVGFVLGAWGLNIDIVPAAPDIGSY
jgi:hypothetical protein